MWKFKITLLLVILTFFSIVNAQFNGNNMMQIQYGELPGDTKSEPTIYDRATLNYSLISFKAGLTIEQFYSPFRERNYFNLSQFSLQYSSKYLDVKLGNFYETLGRGLLLRSYEIPGAILEDLSYRSQHYFHRDILGANAKFKYKDFTTKLLYGKPLNNVFPPTQKDFRRLDQVTAIYSDYSFKKQTIGASLMHIKNANESSLYAMTTLSGNLFPFLNYYLETAKNTSTTAIADFSENASFALYGGLNITAGNLGVSVEYKNYNKFLIGTGINEPPALVKEHTYKVLNRSTHVLQPQNEKGYQVEAFYTFPNASVFTLNNTMAVNKFGAIGYTFSELFAEYSFEMKQTHEIKLFADYANDLFKLEENRISGGLYASWKISNTSTLNTDVEFQTFKRSSSAVQNQVLAISYNYKAKFSANVTAELSNDPFLLTTKPTRLWLGTNFKYQLNSKNTLLLFAGQRRGGPACNAGVCYEVLDFSGIELRMTSRF